MKEKPETRSRIMREVKGRDTTPELIVRRLAHAMGYRFRVCRKDLPGCPDIVFPKLRKVIFVHGCFWHGHTCARGGRKPIGQTAAHLAATFAQLSKACLCFDISHARQVDPTMREAAQILLQCKSRLRQLHVSEVNAQSKHDALSLEAVMAFRRVASLIPGDIPIILESRVGEAEIQQEINNVIRALDSSISLAIAGD